MRKLSTVLSVLFAITSVSVGSMALSATVAEAATTGTPSVNVWWPAQNATLDSVQPFKAVIDGRDLGTYLMFWQVDNGGYVKMSDNQTDSPHKEAMVDLSGWNWNSNGQYSVNFIAQDLSGNEIARTNVTIKHGTTAPAPAPAPNLPTNPTAPVSVTTVAPVPAPTPVPTATVATAETARLAIQVWWPTTNAQVTGVQTIKAVLGSNLGAYKMYWSVDGGVQNEMTNSYVTAPHKEAVIDFGSWHWKSTNAYTINLVAKDPSGTVVGMTNVPVYVNGAPVTPAQVPAPAPAPAPASISVSSTHLFVDTNNPATAQAKAWTASRPTDAAVMAKIGATPTATWLGGWNSNVQNDVTKDMTAAAAQNSVPTFVAYNIPGRDCGSYSAGGASDSASYIAWIKQISAGIGSGKALLVLEPDDLANIDCMSTSQQTDRYSMISQALDIFKANNPGLKVYLDAGNSGWVDASTMAGRLNKAGIAKAAGFSLNVSNFFTTAQNTDYGTKVSGMTGGAHFVIDTSRNGNGSNGGQWCNPSGMALGQTPTVSTSAGGATGNPLVDALLWIKQPGESDGTCNGAPAAGGWWADYALGLAKAAGW